MTTYDYIVVGAGTSGTVAAARIAELLDASVLLLEAGGPDDLPGIADPIGFHSLWGTDLDWAYRTEPTKHVHGRTIAVPRGRVLGGSGSINGMIHVSGARRDYDLWESQGNIGWGWSGVENSLSVTASVSSSDAKAVQLRQIDEASSAASENAFIEACRASGYRTDVGDFNHGDLEDVAGYHQIAVDSLGKRSSSASVFLRTPPERGELSIATRARVYDIIIDDSHAIGVRYEHHGVASEAYAAREVVVSAGAIESPKLLELSGVGRRPVLDRLGKKVVFENSHVGEHLQDHLLIGVPYLERNPGVHRVSLGGVGLFTRSSKSRVERGPDLQMQFFPDLRLNSGGSLVDPNTAGFTMAPTLLQPRSEGRVLPVSADSARPPAIHANFLSTDDDVSVLREGIRLARALASSDAFRTLDPEELPPSATASTDGQIDSYIREAAETTFHPVGTCRMARFGCGVVDERLRVQGVGSLRVVDASIMPTIVSANTNATALMIGYMGAAYITEDWNEYRHA